jgi:hypothetical protein
MLLFYGHSSPPDDEEGAIRMAQLRAPVQAPQARPPRYGLLAAAPTVDDGDLRALAGGWEYQPEACGLSGRDSIACAGNVAAMDPSGQRPGIIEGDPIWLWAGDECSTFGFAARDWQGRARRQLAATESYELAAELWDGTVATADGLANPFLASAGANSDTVTNGAADPVDALACIEQGLAELLRGQQGMVHVTPQLLTHLRAADAVAREGTVWTTTMGHIVVADAGYSGAGPGGAAAGASQWAYGTSMIQVRLGPIEVIPGSLDDARNLAAAMDRSVNDIVVLAGRLAGLQWANDCAHVAAQVDLGVCLVGGAS